MIPSNSISNVPANSYFSKSKIYNYAIKIVIDYLFDDWRPFVDEGEGAGTLQGDLGVARQS